MNIQVRKTTEVVTLPLAMFADHSLCLRQMGLLAYIESRLQLDLPVTLDMLQERFVAKRSILAGDIAALVRAGFLKTEGDTKVVEQAGR